MDIVVNIRNNKTKNYSTSTKVSARSGKLLYRKQIAWQYFIPLLLIAGFVPLIVHGKYINLTGTTQSLFWKGQNELLDFFSYWKSRWIISLTMISALIYTFLIKTKKLPLKKEYKYYIPLATYAIFAILSTIFSIDKSTALNGFVDMYQGMWVLVSYVVITFLVINFVNSERDMKLFLYAFTFLIIVEGLLGLGQYFGFDIFNTKFGNHLLVPSRVQISGGLKFEFGKYTIYGTLFNTNFVGSFAALMLPVSTALLILSKDIKKRIISAVALILCLFTWIGCNSRAGYVGVAFSILIAIIMLRKYILKHWKISASIILVGIIFLVGYNHVSKGKLMQRLESMNLLKAIGNLNKQDNKDEFEIKSIELTEDTVRFKTTHQDLNIKAEDDKLFFIDEDGKIIPSKIDDKGYMVVDDPNSSYLKLRVAEAYSGFSIITPQGETNSFKFYISSNGMKMLGIGNRVVDPVVAKTFGPLKGLEKFGSNRGYIWGRTIPLITKHLFIGSGPDNFPYIFPQDDFVEKANAYNTPYMIIDKPHNMYFQILINTGTISLLALLAAWGIYIASSFKLYWSMKYDTFEKSIGLSCFIGIIAYLVAGIFNDQIVSVAPLFWIMLGIGISVNNKVREQMKLVN